VTQQVAEVALEARDGVASDGTPPLLQRREGGLGLGAILGVGHLVPVALEFGLVAPRHERHHVARLMHPAARHARLREGLDKGFAEPR
jgi:hypothetical protein